MTDKAISPLRRRMIEDMTIRNFAPKTQHDYIRRVKNFAAFLGRSPDTASSGGPAPLPAASGSERHGRADRQRHVSALRFFFNVTLDRPRSFDICRLRPRAAQAAGGAEPRGGGAPARCGAGRSSTRRR